MERGTHTWIPARGRHGRVPYDHAGLPPTLPKGSTARKQTASRDQGACNIDPRLRGRGARRRTREPPPRLWTPSGRIPTANYRHPCRTSLGTANLTVRLLRRPRTPTGSRTRQEKGRRNPAKARSTPSRARPRTSFAQRSWTAPRGTQPPRGSRPSPAGFPCRRRRRQRRRAQRPPQHAGDGHAGPHRGRHMDVGARGTLGAVPVRTRRPRLGQPRLGRPVTGNPSADAHASAPVARSSSGRRHRGSKPRRSDARTRSSPTWLPRRRASRGPARSGRPAGQLAFDGHGASARTTETLASQLAFDGHGASARTTETLDSRQHRPERSVIDYHSIAAGVTTPEARSHAGRRHSAATSVSSRLGALPPVTAVPPSVRARSRTLRTTRAPVHFDAGTKSARPRRPAAPPHVTWGQPLSAVHHVGERATGAVAPHSLVRPWPRGH